MSRSTIALVVAALALLVAVFAPMPGSRTLGVTNFDSLTLSDDLIVGDDVTVTGTVDAVGEINYGANNLYVLGHASSGLQTVYGTASITGTATAGHGLTTVTFCMATLGEDPAAGAGDAAHVTVAVSSNVCTLKVWQDDFVSAATETDVAVHWLVIGTP